jgi:hypothetical protein
LPTELNEPSDDLADYSMLLYGAKKIGKTSLAAQFPKALFLATEPGTKALRVYSLNLESWEEFEQCLDELKSAGKKFSTVVIDTVDLLYEMAFNYICRKKIIDHPQDENDYGRTWKEIRVLFRNAVGALLKADRGVIFISHDTEADVDGPEGSYQRTQPTMSRQAMEEIEAVVDVVAYYGYVGTERVLRVRGAQSMMAGSRLQEHFNTKKGEPIVEIPMGSSPKEAYKNFILAFENKLSQPTIPRPEREPEEDRARRPARIKKKTRKGKE